MPKSALIIGAGLGGLLCGRLLSRKGWDVTLLEADEKPGGVLKSFLWEGIPCECGFHSVGGLGPGEALEKIFRPLGLMELPWYKADADEGFPFLRLNAATEEEIRHITGPYTQSTWRLKGGGSTLVEELTKGLKINTGNKVVKIENQSVTCQNERSFKADVTVSSLSPDLTFSLLQDHVRPAYLKRLARMEKGPSIFTVHCLLEPDCVPWQSGDIFLDGQLMLHFGEPGTHLLELLCFGRGRAEEMIARAKTRLPGLVVRKYHTLTSAGYGYIKHSRADYIAPATPLPWLFLTGQNLGLHGILGTAVSALNTCKCIES
ncbi:MAG: FAD-dependent oxidoreductase [Bacteroidales bacterium]|nr:FAD-dependent oxidoreductase [Bacteroidales bacterium]